MVNIVNWNNKLIFYLSVLYYVISNYSVQFKKLDIWKNMH